MATLELALSATLALGLIACGTDSDSSGNGGSAGNSVGGSAGSGGGAGAESGGSAGASTGGTAGSSALVPACFKAPSPDPVIKYGDFFADSTWNDPHVLKRADGGYVMYASASAGFANIRVRIYRLTSQDAKSWVLDPMTPVFEPSGNMESVETPSVVLFKGKYHLFVTTYPDQADATSYRVAHAVSDDGLSFTLTDETFVVPSGNADDFNGSVVADPGAVVIGDELLVYFTAIGGDPNGTRQQEVIGVVSSSDGTTFSTPSVALAPDRTLYPRGDGWIGFSTPFPALIDGQVQLFTDVVNDEHDPNYDADWLQVALQLAVSPDGKTGFSQYPDRIFERADFSWTQREIRAVAVLEDTDRVRMWFAGDQVFTLDGSGNPTYHLERWGIGYAECLR